MKVIAFNGSPKKEGNTFHGLQMVTEELEKEGIETKIVQVGNKEIRGCTACNGCAKNRNEKCILPGDEVNDWIQQIKDADGIILGAPVHFSGIGSTMKSFLDRAFYVASNNNSLFRHKVGAGLVAVRRSGGSASLDQLNHYLTYSEMIIPSSNYWNIIHGTSPGESIQDQEGAQIMRMLGKNMAWLLKLIEHGRGTIDPPDMEEKTFMNFIR